MCEHEKHEHCHEHNHNGQKRLLVRISAAVLIFISAFVFPIEDVLKFTVYALAYLLAGGDVLLRAAKNIIKGQVFDENFLMGIATLGAFAIKEYPEAVMVMVLYQIGEYFQHMAVEKSRKSIQSLMDIRPDYANIEQDGVLQKVEPAIVKKNDIIVVKTGEKIPLDGIVTEGEALVDTSALTGESVPVSVKHGDSVLSGCINTNGFLKISVTKEFGESTVSKILELVEHASSKKTKTENFITKFARYYTPAVVAGALLLAVIPPLFVEGAQFSIWIYRALTFLVISCPCALVISVPLSFFAGIGGASKCGILIKGSNYLEVLSHVETAVFDKTGTLTKGVFAVNKIIGESKDDILHYGALAEAYSNHPIACALKSAYGKSIDSNIVTNITEHAGKGVEAYVEGVHILAGNAALMEKFNIEHAKVNEAGTLVYVAKDNKYLGCIVISDEVKDDAQSAIRELKTKAHIKNTVMLTGDSPMAAEAAAQKLGIDKFYAQLLPAQKVEITEKLLKEKSKNSSVIFVGDGINDAPVLTLADAGIAMGGLGSDAAIEAADVVIMDDKPSKIYVLIKIARKTLNIVKQNIAFAIGIKILFLALGAIGFVTMWGAVFADVGVTFVAILNALRALHTSDFIKQ